MRIALFTDTFGQTNGVTRTLYRLVRHQPRDDIEIDLYTYGAREEQEQMATGRIYRFAPALPIHYYPGMPFDGALGNFRVLSAFRASRYDVVHVATPGSMGICGIALAGQYRIPMIGTYHTSLPAYVRARARLFADQLCSLTWSYVKWFYGRCRLVLAPSISIKSELERHLRVPIGIFSRGVDTELFAPSWRRRDDDGPPRILYVGRLAPEKNIEMLVEAFGRMRQEALLQIVGEGPLHDSLRRSRDERVRALGLMHGQELSTTYASADVFAYPSRTDTFGNAVLEAMSSGLPAVVMDEGGPKEIVTDGHDGFVVSDADTMRQRLEQLISDERLRRRMGRNARATAEARSWDKAFRHLFEAYRRVGDIDRRRRSAKS